MKALHKGGGDGDHHKIGAMAMETTIISMAILFTI
jgi:hypothetical protein